MPEKLKHMLKLRMSRCGSILLHKKFSYMFRNTPMAKAQMPISMLYGYELQMMIKHSAKLNNL